jgi:hypothetical protein
MPITIRKSQQKQQSDTSRFERASQRSANGDGHDGATDGDLPLPVKPVEAKDDGKEHNYARIFEQFGVGFGAVSNSGEAVAEECPFCGRDKFHLNIRSGLYHCKHCNEKGNVTTFLTWLHKELLDATTEEHYAALKEKRGIAIQSLRHFELAYDRSEGRWLIPFKNAQGSVVNIQFYYPGRGKLNKINLPGLPLCIFGFEKLTDRKKRVLLCEGPFDAIALHYNLGHNRDRYIIVATPGGFKKEWAPLFKGFRVQALYDNDDAGSQHRESVRILLGESGIAAELTLLKWPEPFPDGYDINDLIRDPKYGNGAKNSVLDFLNKHCVKVVVEPKLRCTFGWQRQPGVARPIDWVWPGHLRCGTYASFSGHKGTMKSTITRELVARYTKGLPMPGCDTAGMPPGYVVWVTAEEQEDEVWEHLEFAGADLNKVMVIPATLRDADMLNVLEHFKEMEQLYIKPYGARLVVLDGQNSVVGAPNISTDILARNNVTNKLHQFAQRLDVCLLGIRNEDAEGRALGPQSMGDIGRCVWRAVEAGKDGDDRYFTLKFVRISDAAPKLHPDLPYSVQDCGGARRKILWGKSLEQVAKQAIAKVRAKQGQGKERQKNGAKL